jgi:hypothetical protein
MSTLQFGKVEFTNKKSQLGQCGLMQFGIVELEKRKNELDKKKK